jgi:8-oxo-dGTP diphosphatase
MKKFAPLARLPASAWSILREAARHLLKRPVVGVAAAAQVPDGRWVLIRRGDVGAWCVPGGTLEWGETLTEALRRELLEETGTELRSVGHLVGVFSRPDRDPRFHAVTIVVRCEVSLPTRPPANPLEILEVGLFADAALPAELAFGTSDMLDAARRGGEPVFE